MSVRFSASIVTFEPDAALLERALASLAAALAHSREAGLVSAAQVFVVDNGGADSLATVRRALPRLGGEKVELVHGHGNVGYGRANNLVIGQLDSDVHLVMNPDVELERETLTQSLRALQADPSLGIVAPAARGSAGEVQYLCKRYPSVWVLFLRGFAPARLRRAFSRVLDDYEMRDVVDAQASASVTLASGCFMLMRTALFRRLGGFDPRFFMYFEDYDLSLRAGREGRVAYVPAARIVHHGGEASRKGPRHVAWFVRSACRFFSLHGWKLA